MNANNALIITNPRGNEAAAIETCSFIARRTRELLAAAARVEVTAETWNSPQTRAAIEELETANEDLRESGRALVEAIAAETEAKRILTQIDERLYTLGRKIPADCAYGRISAAIKELKAKRDAFKAAALPPAPTHGYAIQLRTTDADLKKILAAIEKTGANYRVASADGAAAEALDKWFAEAEK